jgi:hypothetical protein
MMKPGTLRWTIAAVAIAFAMFIVWTVFSAPKHPVALIRVVDAAGKPVAGAIITPEGLRTKSGSYQSGWYGWPTAGNSVSNPPVKTDANGFAHVGYPKYVFERIETGVLCLSVSDPNFVPDRPERAVATAPPAGAPWRVWADYLKDRIMHKELLSRVDPVVLQQGATLKVAMLLDSAAHWRTPLFVQISGDGNDDTNFWLHPEPDVTMTRRLAAGKHTVRAVRFDTAGVAWFSDTTSLQSVAGQTNDLILPLARGVTLRGELDSAVPRPVKNGRVIVHVWPPGCAPQDDPPQWHAWAAVREDGSFEIPSLPQGDLEVVALCNGFVSTNGPGKFHFRYPQKHVLGADDLDITIGMEPTARLEVRVTDNQGKPVKGALVSTWPNVRYGEWAAVRLAQDCYLTSDIMLSPAGKTYSFWNRHVPDLEGTSDDNGLAVIPNLPADVTQIAVDHPQLAPPAVLTPMGEKSREASVQLIAGVTNHASVQLEPKDKSPIAHY